MDRRDARRLGRRDTARRNWLTVDEDAPGIRRHRPGEDFDERGLARAVLAAEGVDFARLDGQMDLGQRADAAVGLADPLRRDKGNAHGWGRTPRRFIPLSNREERRAKCKV